MRTLRIIADTVVRGILAHKGDVVRVDDADARLLIECVRAEPCEEPEAEAAEEPTAPVIEPEAGETEEPEGPEAALGEEEDKNDKKKRRNR